MLGRTIIQCLFEYDTLSQTEQEQEEKGAFAVCDPSCFPFPGPLAI